MKKVLILVVIVSVLSSLFISSVTTVSASPTPVVQLSFEGDLKNKAGTDYNGKSVGNVSYEEKGAVGKGLFLNNGYVELENSKNIKFDKQISFTAWVRVENEEIFNPTILMKDKDDESGCMPFNFGFCLGYTALGTSFGFDVPENESGSWETESGGIFDSQLVKDKWHHIAAVFDGKFCTYYVDGKYVDSKEISSEFENFVKIHESGKSIYIGRGTDNFRGYIDEFKLFNTAISATDVAAISSEGRKVLNNKMVLKIDDPNMIINGVEKEIDPGRGTTPILDASRTLVPIRAIVEEMGGTISFDAKDQRGRVDITLGSKNIKIWLYNQNTQVDGKPYKLDVIPKTINGRTMLPLRFVVENLGAEVGWNNDTSEITISYAK